MAQAGMAAEGNMDGLAAVPRDPFKQKGFFVKFWC